MEGERDGRGWEKRGEERGREGLPPLYLTSGYGPVYYGFFSPQESTPQTAYLSVQTANED